MSPRHFLLFRAVLIETLLLQGLYAPMGGIDSASWAILGAYAIISIMLYALDRAGRMHERLRLGSFLFDIGATTAVLYWGRGIASDFYAAYFLVILASSLLRSSAYSLVVGLAACAVYGAFALPRDAWTSDPAALLRLSLLSATALFGAFVAEASREQSAEAERGFAERLAWMERLGLAGRLLAAVLHEIRTPLNTILLNAEDLMDWLPEPVRREAEPQLGLIRGEAERATLILRDNFDFVSPADLSLSTVPVSAPVRRALKSAEAALRERNISVENRIAETVSILGSERHLVQVFINLINNAVEAMPFGGRLSLSAESLGGFVEISIADTGIGLEPDMIESLFEPFETGKKKGTGIGLFVCRWIVERHGGSISVQSEGDRRGATVRLRLPES